MATVNPGKHGVSLSCAKEIWETPEMQVIRFSCTDVICTSGSSGGSSGGKAGDDSYDYDRADWFTN